jgi:Holliday junction resolvase-like predicted endonuclease
MVDKKHKGCVNELGAVVWLMAGGYEVCRNLSQHGPVDLVAIKGAEVILIDVKQGYKTADGICAAKLTPRQKSLGVVELVAIGDEFFWNKI